MWLSPLRKNLDNITHGIQSCPLDWTGLEVMCRRVLAHSVGFENNDSKSKEYTFYSPSLVFTENSGKVETREKYETQNFFTGISGHQHRLPNRLNSVILWDVFV